MAEIRYELQFQVSRCVVLIEDSPDMQFCRMDDSGVGV